MFRSTRRDFLQVACGLAAWTGPGAPPVNASTSYFRLESYLFADHKRSRRFRPAQQGSIVLEAIIASHVPQLLIISPAGNSTETLIGADVVREFEGVNKIYELRRYGVPKANKEGDVLRVDAPEHCGIPPILKGNIAGRLVYVIGYASLEARAKAWDSLLGDSISQPPEEIGIYRRRPHS